MDIVRHAGALSVGNVSRPLGIEQPPSRPSSSGGPASSSFVALGATDGFSSSRVCIVPVSFFFFFFLFPPFLGSCVQVFARYLPGSQGPVSTGTGLDEVGVPKVTMRLQQLRGPDLDGLDRVMGKGDIDEH